MSDELLELALRCERARGPDAELSAAIALVIHRDWLREVPGNKPLNCRVRNASGSPVYIGGMTDAMHYTASLDAAVKLAPEGLRVLIDSYGCHCRITDPHDTTTYMPWNGFGSLAATMPLAITAAALRARASHLRIEVE